MADATNTPGPSTPDNPTAGATAGGQAANQPPAAPSAGDIQAQINAALAQQRTDFLDQLKQATGFDSFDAIKENKLKTEGKLQELADTRAAEAQTYKAKFQQTAIGNALLSASTEAVDPAVVAQLLAGHCVCDDDGKVSIDGKPVAEAVKALLADKPFLAKAQGGTGSGAPAGGQGTAAAQQNYQTAAKNKDVLGMLKLNTGASN